MQHRDKKPQQRSSSRARSFTAAIVSFAFASCAHAEYAKPDLILDQNKTLDQVMFAMAHNAFNHAGALPNQNLTIREQLDRGVRAFQLDVYDHGGRLQVCHGTCIIGSRVAPLEEDLTTISNYLQAHADAIVVVHIEFDGGISRERFARFASDHHNALRFNFNPDAAGNAEASNWPTVKSMIQTGSRMVLMNHRAALSGEYSFSGGRTPLYMFHDQEVLVQNTYNLGNTVGQHDYTCETRWSSIPLQTRTGYRGWNRLFLMNHFHQASAGDFTLLHTNFDNRWDHIEDRERRHCKLPPNFVSVDGISNGDVLEYVEYRNNGGLIAYEGDNMGGDVVCGFSTAIRRKWSMHDGERLGCENDEMRSIVLRGMKKGQRVTFADRPDGVRDDDFGILDIDADIPVDKPVTIKTLNQSASGSAFRYVYSGGNGLAGKVSNITVEPHASTWSAASMALLNQTNGNGRVSCGFGLTRSGFWNIKKESNCHNDDAKSLKILTAPKGTVVTVYDSPGGSTNDDYTTITVTQDIRNGYVVDNLERTYKSEFVSVSYSKHNGLNGKVSSVRVRTP